MLVVVDDHRLAFALRNRYRNDLVLESSFLYRGDGAALTFGGKRVLIGAVDGISRRDLLGRDPHMASLDAAGQPLAQHRIDRVSVAHPAAPSRAFQEIGRV